ncbi:MAG TPA: hypothetical protein PLI95_17540 [Polyangiaceae bacterium]|nr:hypothetical protein [Polyangiaceae bacterium]
MDPCRSIRVEKSQGILQARGLQHDHPMLHTILQDRRGANLVEYIILVGVVALIALAGFKTFGSKVWDKSQKQAESVAAIGN